MGRQIEHSLTTTLWSERFDYSILRGGARLIERTVGVWRLIELYEQAAVQGQGDHFFTTALDALRVHYNIGGSVQNIPAQGSLLVVCNHPFGGVEGLILLRELGFIRSDVRALGNEVLGYFPALAPFLFTVNPFDGATARSRNIKPLREALAWLKQGHCLLMFPGGEVSAYQWNERRITEPTWPKTAGWLASSSGASVVPVYIGGRNSILFHSLGMLHPRARTGLLAREMLNKHRRIIQIKVGGALPEKTRVTQSDESLTEDMQRHITELARRPMVNQEFISHEPVAGPTSNQAMEKEIARITPQHLLLSNGNYRVFCAPAREIPALLDEIGRLRELTFRMAQEGTGKARDLDRFDEYYHHLFIWNDQRQEIVGAYRMGLADKIVMDKGQEGLYTTTLFRFKPAFFRKVSPALELGRSFVRYEYQKSYKPLLLLWQGIGCYLVAHPHYRYLVGPVSIADSYQPRSRLMMARFLKRYCSDPRLRRLVKPTHPMRSRRSGRILAGLRNADVEALSARIAKVETDGKGVPVLLRQYLKLNGKTIGFNLDPAFSNVLDVLLVVDCLQTEAKQRERYMGKEGAMRYMEWHEQGGYRRAIA